MQEDNSWTGILSEKKKESREKEWQEGWTGIKDSYYDKMIYNY